MPFKAEPRPAGICGALEVSSEGQGEGSSGGGAPRSDSDISQPLANSFCIVVAPALLHSESTSNYTSQESLGSGETIVAFSPPHHQTGRQGQIILNCPLSSVHDCCPLTACVCSWLCVYIHQTERKW